MLEAVNTKPWGATESLITMDASIWPFSSMASHVDFKIRPVCKSSLTNSTFERFFPLKHKFITLQTKVLKCKKMSLLNIIIVTCMRPHMKLQIASIKGNTEIEIRVAT